jgi:hypothetical protein
VGPTMSSALRDFLTTFDTSFRNLSDDEKRQAITAICRRIAKQDYAAVTDNELIATAEAAFLDLDARETMRTRMDRGFDDVG